MSLFQVHEHTVPCQHIRHYAHATLDSQEDILHLAVKQYTPLDNLHPGPGDLTIIGGHANAFPKELYEPLWDELLKLSKAAGFRIRNIWIADVSHQGFSGVINESKLGNDPSWFDHPRDLLQMINHFRGEMPRPIIGVGHSMGGNNLVNLSLIHPRLFESLILIDPVIQTHTSPKGNVMPAQSSTVRRDVWPSRKAASESFSRSKFYQSWDPRVLKLWIKYGLRDLPTKLHPEKQRASIPAGPITPEATLGPVAKDKEITLTTTKHQEVASFLRPYLGAEFPAGLSEEQLAHLSKLTYPDLPNNWDMSTKVYRPEPMITFNNLPHLRPSVLYIFGELSPMSNADFRVQKMAVTGIGVSGSGGAKEGRVKEELIMGVGHLIPMENVGETSRLASEWIGSELIRWRKGEELVANQWKQIPEDEKYTLGKRFTALMHNDLGAGRSQKPGAPKL